MQFTAKTVEEAKIKGLIELGITEDQAEITVIKEAVKGLFGRVKEDAIVEVSLKKSDENKVVEFVQGIVDLMDLKAVAELDDSKDNTVINLTSKDSANVIGYRGEVLDAIQTLAGAALNIGKKDYQKVVVDCENYREKREETLIKLANKLESKATEMRREVILEPMSPFERRIIHTALAKSQTVTTRSDGKEPNRYVVIVPNDKDQGAKPYNAARNSDKGFKSDKKRGDKNFKGGRKPNKPFKKESSGEKRKSGIVFGTYLGNSLKK